MPADSQHVRRRVPGLQDPGRGNRQGETTALFPLAARVILLLCAGRFQSPLLIVSDAESCPQVYFEVAKPEPDGPGIDYTQLDDSCRFIQYSFPAEVLSLSNIGTT